jgi:Na+/H+ antiporter NhaD/arsenite permease-like protein
MEFTLPIVLSGLVFIATFALIITEKVHRTVISMFGALLLVILGSIFNFYSPEQAFEAIDFNTIGLLIGMMIIVVILEETGFLEYLAIVSAKKTRGNPWFLVVMLGTVTTVLSFILDNVTTVIIIVPVTILIARMTKISATPLLMAEALLSDTGGVATLVGDPPNIMIGSAAGFSFNDFLTHIAPIVIVAWFVTLISLKIVFRKELAKKPDNIDDLMQWDAKKSIKDKAGVIKSLCVLALVVTLFFVHAKLHIEPAFVALIGAVLILTLVNLTKDPQKIFEKLEWSVLGFFVSLFIMVGALEHSGVIKQITDIILNNSSDNQVMMAIMLLWIAAFASAVIDNIPFTMAMIPVLLQMQQNSGTGGNVNLLWWALAMGVGFGGNGSPIGSTANVVVVSKSEETDDPITFIKWFKSGTIATIATCIVGTLAILLFHKYLSK